MKFRLLWSQIVESKNGNAEPQNNVSVYLGDTPQVTAQKTLRAPLVGTNYAPLPREVMLIASNVAQRLAGLSHEELYDRASRGDLFVGRQLPQVGNFSVETPQLPSGDYDAWLLEVTD